MKKQICTYQFRKDPVPKTGRRKKIPWRTYKICGSNYRKATYGCLKRNKGVWRPFRYFEDWHPQWGGGKLRNKPSKSWKDRTKLKKQWMKNIRN